MALSKSDFVYALHLLVNGGRAAEAKDNVDEAERFYNRQEAWRTSPGLVGFGVAERATDGEGTGELALKVYVERKLALADIATRIPRWLTVPGLDERVAIDVSPVGKLAPQPMLEPQAKRLRPAKCGTQICHPKGAPGTLGCLVERTSDNGKWLILSAGHVLSPFGVAKKYDLIQQPALAGDDTERNAIATLNQPVVFAERYLNKFDAALARVLRRADVSPELLQIGRIGSELGALRVGKRVNIVGAFSGKQTGEIVDRHFCTRIEYADPQPTTAGFQDQVLCSRYSAGGDSGALVFDDGACALGIHIAGSDSYSVFSPLAPILSEWGLAIVRSAISSASVATAHTAPPVDDRDRAIDILARTVWGEAEGEEEAGWHAVAAVVVNRTKRPKRFAGTVERVCRQALQFSCWNPGPRRNLMVAVSTSDAIFAQCINIATTAVDGQLEDPVLGADHYHEKSIVPSWAVGQVPCASIGRHLFYNTIA